MRPMSDPHAPIPPALTPKEWQERSVDISCGLVWANLADRHAFDGEPEANNEPPPRLVIDWNSANYQQVVGRRHALAALCLHGQAFGFTHEDVEDLRWFGSAFMVPGTGASRRALNLAARIAALLPPPPETPKP